MRILRISAAILLCFGIIMTSMGCRNNGGNKPGDEGVEALESGAVSEKESGEPAPENEYESERVTDQRTDPDLNPNADDTTAADTTAADTTADDTTAADTTADDTTAADTTPAPTEEAEAEGSDDSQWHMILVNPENYLPEDFEPQLQDIGNGHKADYRIVGALNAMLQGCRDAGLSPLVCSSYRTYERQVTLFENKVNQYMGYGYTRDMAESYASMWVAIPGTSEHHTGLAFDIVASDYVVLDSSQATTRVQQWLMENCHNYGFILRYPEDKVNITGINYEPWHYRYVGVEAATYIMEHGICLEEYLGG